MRAGASTPTIRFVQRKTQEIQNQRANTPGPGGNENNESSSFLTGVDLPTSSSNNNRATPSSILAANKTTNNHNTHHQKKKSVSYSSKNNDNNEIPSSSNASTSSTSMVSGIRGKIALAMQIRNNEHAASAGLVHGTKELTATAVRGRKVFVRCADDTSIQPWPLSSAIANVAAITGDMQMMQRHGLLDPSSELHPLFSLDQMRRLYEAQCADCKRPVTDERLARFCETLGNFACGEQFIMRECKFEHHSIRAICGIFGEGGIPASISHLDLSGNNIGSDGGRLLAQTLPKLNDLCVLRLGSANLGDGIAAIAAALRDNQTVTHFDLSATHTGAHRNSILGDTVRVMSTMLRRNRVLAHINLSNTSIKGSGPILMDSMALCRTLVHVGLRDNGLDHECAEPLAKMVTQLRVLETLDLGENKLTGPSIELLCRALCTRKVDRRAGTVLQTLDLSKNKIDAAVDSAVQALCDMIETLGVRRLVLSDNDLCRTGYDPLEGTRLPPTTDLIAKIFASASKMSSGIEWLEMANCGFNDLPRVVIDLMVVPSTLTRLDLSRNNLRDTGCIVLTEGLACTESNLIQLDISQNNITTAGAKLIARALRTNCTLRNLKCYNGARMDEEKSGLVEAIIGHKKLETVDLQKACFHDVKPTLERNRKQRSIDSLPQAEATREKTLQLARETTDVVDQVKEERHRLEHQLDVLKIMRERAKSTSDSQKETVNSLTNETVEWRAQYEEMLTRHKELHEEILSKQQRLNRKLEDATRKADKEMADKNHLLTEAWNAFMEFEMQGFTKCHIDVPALHPPGQVKVKYDDMKKKEKPADEELHLEQELEKVLAQIKDQKSTCDMYHNKLLELGVREEDIQDCFPEGHPDSLKVQREVREQQLAAEREKHLKLEEERAALEEAEAKKKAEEDAKRNRFGGGGGNNANRSNSRAAAAASSSSTSKKPGGKKPKGKKPVKTVRAGGK